MDARHWVILAIANLAFVGCRYHDPSIDLLESELRWMEDQLYLLEDEVQMKNRELALCKEGPSTGRDASPTTRRRAATKNDSPREILPPSDDDPDFTAEPLIELPSPSDDSGPSPTPAESPSTGSPGQDPRDNGFRDELRMDEPAAPGYPTSPPILELPGSQTMHSDPLIAPQSFETPLKEQDIDPYVTHIVVHSQLAGGYDFDGRPGAEGLLVIVEPRNADGQYVPLSGAVSVVALDGNHEGPAARVGRWDFDAAEVGRTLRKSPLGRGVHLELAWPKDPPDTGQLHIFARYVTADGRKLQADHKTDGNASHPTIRGWTPAKRSPPRTLSSSVNHPFLGDQLSSDAQVATRKSSLESRTASVLAVAQQLEESVAAIEQTLAAGAVPRQLTPPPAARPLRAPKKTPDQPIQRPEWAPNRASSHR